MIVQLGGQTRSGSPRAWRTRACRSSACRRRRSTSPRIAAPSALLAEDGPAQPASTASPRVRRGDREIAERDRLPGAGAAVVRARRPRHGDRLRRRRAAAFIGAAPRSLRAPGARSTGSSTTRSRSTSTRSSTAPRMFLGGVMEHIEEAGIHSGDSSCALPPITLGATIDGSRRSRAIARGVGVWGLLNVQYALGPTCSTCWRPTRAPRAPCRSSPRRPRAAREAAAGDAGREPSPTLVVMPARATAEPAAGTPDRGQGAGDAVQPVPHPGVATSPCSARR